MQPLIVAASLIRAAACQRLRALRRLLKLPPAGERVARNAHELPHDLAAESLRVAGHGVRNGAADPLCRAIDIRHRQCLVAQA